MQFHRILLLAFAGTHASALGTSKPPVIVHIHGLPWEVESNQVAAHVGPLLPSFCRLDEGLPLLPLDKRARRTGRALLRIHVAQDDVEQASSAICRALQGQMIGTRWLSARASDEAEYAFQKRQVAAILESIDGRALTEAYLGRSEQASAVRLPTDERDVVVCCHNVAACVAAGDFDLNNLPAGRVDVLARCVSSALMVSHGIRRHTRVWLVFDGCGLTLSCDGGTAKGLHPDERTIASAIKRLLASTEAGGRGAVPDGWSAHCDRSLGQLLPQLTRRGASSGAQRGTPHLLMLHERGRRLAEWCTDCVADCRRPSGDGGGDGDVGGGGGDGDGGGGTVIVLGDQQGFTSAEEALVDGLGGERVALGPVPLLASHCIVLAHAALDGVFYDCNPH